MHALGTDTYSSRFDIFLQIYYCLCHFIPTIQTRKMLKDIDSIDHDIVRLLILDGRMSSAEIARRIDKSERIVRYRIDRLLKERVIRVSAVVDPRAVGFSVTADVWVAVEPGRVMEVARRLAQFGEVSYVACSTGDRDVSIQVNSTSIAELYEFVTEVVSNVAGVTRTSTLIVPLILKDVYDWQIPGPEAGSEPAEELDS
jgi:Lrp/AsnC family transcriptional regulator, regulator for asnA, asnC and gidA